MRKCGRIIFEHVRFQVNKSKRSGAALSDNLGPPYIQAFEFSFRWKNWNWKDEIRTSKANEAHHECIDLCKFNVIFATLASPIDTSVIRRMEKTQILEESGFAHVYDKALYHKGYKKTGNLRWANRTRLRTRFTAYKNLERSFNNLRDDILVLSSIVFDESWSSNSWLREASVSYQFFHPNLLSSHKYFAFFGGWMKSAAPSWFLVCSKNVRRSWDNPLVEILENKPLFFWNIYFFNCLSYLFSIRFWVEKGKKLF